jgi:hypothetical protein
MPFPGFLKALTGFDAVQSRSALHVANGLVRYWYRYLVLKQKTRLSGVACLDGFRGTR